MSSSKKSKSGTKKPSVFERLGSKPSMVTEEYCKQWAHKGTCSYLNKCKYIETHNSKNYKNATPSKDTRRKSRSRSRSPVGRKELPTSKVKPIQKTAKAVDSGEWEKSLENEDEIALERKLQMLQRELAKQEEQEHKGRGKKPVARKRERSSSSSSSSSTSSSSSSSDSSDSSSSSSFTSTSSSSSSSDSDGELKERRSKKRSNRSKASLKIHGAKEKAKAKARKLAKLSPNAQSLRKKDNLMKKQGRGISSPKRHASATKHGRESPTYSSRSRSPRMKEIDLMARDRRHRRSPELADGKRKTDVTLPRRRDDPLSPPPGERSRDRKLASSFDVRGKVDGSRERLLEPEYLMRSRSPIPVHGYRDPYAVRELSPVPSMYRDRPRVGEPYESRRVYSPPLLPKSELKDDIYDTRLRRPISPDPMRRPLSARKDYRDYEHDWVMGPDQAKLDWDHPDYRRRGRPIDDAWSRSEVPWKKGYSPPPIGYPEPLPPSRSTSWDAIPKPPSVRSDEIKRERRNGAADGRRSRGAAKRAPDPPKTPTPTNAAARSDEAASPDQAEQVSAPPKSEDLAESRPGSSAVELEEAENFSDFSDDVDEILNRDLQEPKSEKTEDAPQSDSEEPEQAEASVDGETKAHAGTTQQSDAPSPKPITPLPSAIEMRSTDDDLLGGMDIEQISDEEFEDDTRTSSVDALEVDWTSLACKREKKAEPTIGARQRWQGRAVLARLGIKKESEDSREVPTPERKPLFDSSILLTRALSARMDLALRRSLCNLPPRELTLDSNDRDPSLFRASVDLFLKDQILAN